MKQIRAQFSQSLLLVFMFLVAIKERWLSWLVFEEVAEIECRFFICWISFLFLFFPQILFCFSGFQPAVERSSENLTDHI